MLERMNSKLIIPLIAALALLLLSAQNGAAQTTPEPASPIAQEELEAFAAASLEVESLSQALQADVQQAQTPEEQETLQTEAMEEMAAAVNEEGLSVERYNQIYSVAQADPAIAQSIQEYRQALQ